MNENLNIEQHPTLESLDNLVNRIMRAAKELEKELERRKNRSSDING